MFCSAVEQAVIWAGDMDSNLWVHCVWLQHVSA